MPTNKNATIRYQVLDNCFRNPGRRYYINDLIEACNRAIYEFSGIEDGVKLRQILDDIRFMESEQGWNECVYHVCCVFCISDSWKVNRDGTFH